MKRLTILLVAVFTILTGCAKAEQMSFNVSTLSGPTAIGFLNMMETSDHNFEILGSPDEVVAKIVKGETDIAAVPANLASVLYNKTEGDISVLAINTLGVLYIVENGQQINDIADLEGKTIYSTGKGATPEYVLNYILEKSGVSANVEFKSEHSELAALMGSGEAEIAMLPQPFVTSAMSKNADLRVALDVNEMWESVDGNGNLITGVLIVRNEVIEKYKTSIDAFLEEYNKSITKANNDVTNTANLAEKYDILPAQIAEKAIPFCNIVYIDGENMKKDLSNYLEILYNEAKTSVGGNLPSEEFYYKK